MRSLHRQRGLGWFGLLFLAAVFGFVAIVVVKMLPMYLNQMKIESAVHKVAADPENGNADPIAIRKELKKFWDIDSVDYLEVNDVKVKRTETGRFLSYDYETRERLFYNIYIVVHFADDVQLANVQS